MAEPERGTSHDPTPPYVRVPVQPRRPPPQPVLRVMGVQIASWKRRNPWTPPEASCPLVEGSRPFCRLGRGQSLEVRGYSAPKRHPLQSRDVPIWFRNPFRRREAKVGLASASFALDHAKLVALDVGQRRPLEVLVLDVPQTGCAESDEAFDLCLTVRRVPIEMHPILRDLALGHLHEIEARIAGERSPRSGFAFAEFTFQRSRPETADPLRVVCIEDDREER